MGANSHMTSCMWPSKGEGEVGVASLDLKGHHSAPGCSDRGGSIAGEDNQEA